MPSNKYVVTQENRASTSSKTRSSGVFVVEGAENLGFQADDAGASPNADLQPQSEMSKFKEMPSEPGDNLRLAFLIGFPLVCFIVGTVITGLNV